MNVGDVVTLMAHRNQYGENLTHIDYGMSYPNPVTGNSYTVAQIETWKEAFSYSADVDFLVVTLAELPDLWFRSDDLNILNM